MKHESESLIDEMMELFTGEWVSTSEDESREWNATALDGELKLPAHLIVVFKNSESGTVNAVQKEILVRMISKMGIEPSQVACVNVANHTVGIFAMKKKLSATNFIVFDCTPEELLLNLNPPKNKSFHFAGLQLAFTKSIEEVDKNKDVKFELWSKAVVPMFQLQTTKK